MSKNRFALAFAPAATALTLSIIATAGLSGSASATSDDTTSDPTTLTLDRNTGLPSGSTRDPVVDDWPENDYAGEIQIWGIDYGFALWDDYDGDHHQDYDRDNFYVVDLNDDDLHVSLSVTHNGKTYTEHDAGGKAAFIGVGNIKDGETVQLKGCAWNADHRLLGCAENELTE